MRSRRKKKPSAPRTADGATWWQPLPFAIRAEIGVKRKFSLRLRWMDVEIRYAPNGRAGKRRKQKREDNDSVLSHRARQSHQRVPDRKRGVARADGWRWTKHADAILN